MSDLTVPIYFFWQQASADPRQFNQQRTLLSPEIYVAVNVPLKADYVHNAEEIIQAQLHAEEAIAPILTPLGMVYADNVLRAAYSTLEGHGDEDNSDEEEIEWGYDDGLSMDEVVSKKLEDDDEFPVEEMFDEEDEDLHEILWEN